MVSDPCVQWYCSEVKAITYSNFPGSGSYDKITNMDPNTGQCTSEKHAYSGSLAPMSEEVSAQAIVSSWNQANKTGGSSQCISGAQR